MAIGLIFIILGLSFQEHTELAIIGFLFLFLLSFNLINGTLEYETGTAQVYRYGNNFSGYHWDYADPLEPRPQDPDEAFIFHIDETKDYTTYQNVSMGIYMALISLFGIIIMLFNIKPTNWRRE